MRCAGSPFSLSLSIKLTTRFRTRTVIAKEFHASGRTVAIQKGMKDRSTKLTTKIHRVQKPDT